MTTPAELVPAAWIPADLLLEPTWDWEIIRDLTLEIGAPYAWPSQQWSDSQWQLYTETEDLQHWIATRRGTRLGLASIRFWAEEVQIDTFGLLPRFVGLGLGGAVLTMVIQRAWAEAHSPRRLWLHTSSEDHPAALPNYLERGLRAYAVARPASGGLETFHQAKYLIPR
jgi:GNAT superfamily N-acetyltransferase